MAQVYTNNAAGLLANELSISGTSLILQSGQGSKFPALGGADTFKVTLFSVVNNVELNHEIVNVTARVNDTLTIQRAQENTTARLWPVNTIVELRVTAGTLANIQSDAATANATAIATANDLDTTDNNLSSHTINTANPHSVTKTQIGLSNVTNDAQLKIASNLADLNNTSTARTNLGLGTAAVANSTAFEPANSNIQTHISSTSNPHTVTKTQVGLSNVSNDAQLKIASNLSDLNNVVTARTNLGLGTLALESTVEGAMSTPFSFRNKLINGNFDIWQRDTSQTSSGYGSDDRWTNSNVGTTKTASMQAFALGQTGVPGNPKYFSRTVVSSVAGASNYCIKNQKIEDVRTLAGETATLSFYARADAAKNMAVELDQFFGTGGTPSADVTGIGVTTVPLTTAWQKFTVTVEIPSIAGKILGTNADNFIRVAFWFDAGSNYNARTNSLGQQSGTFDIAQVQLEEGSVATPFEDRPIGLELSLCHRYYEVMPITLSNLAGTAGLFRHRFMTTKRVIPTLTVISGSLSGANLDALNPSGFRQGTLAASASSAGIAIDAEL